LGRTLYIYIYVYTHTQAGKSNLVYTQYFTSLNGVDILREFNVRNGNRYITDVNDVGPHTAQIYNERTSTDFNLVTTESTIHKPSEDCLKNGPKHVGTSFKCF
jgi:hypothetical protein